MKKLLLILFAIVLCTSCSLDDDDQVNVTYQLVPIETVTIPDTMVVGTEYEIELSYTLPSDCHTFNGLIAEEQENLLYIGAQTVYEMENTGCDESPETAQSSFKFAPTITYDSYTFKFWQAENEDQEAIYLTKNVVIISEEGGNE